MERKVLLEETKKNLAFVNRKLSNIRESNETNRMDIKDQADFHRFAEAQYYLVKSLNELGRKAW